MTILSVLLLTALAVSGYLFYQYRRVLHTNPTGERQSIIEHIKDTVALPAEEPTVSTVIDKTKLTNAAMRQRAENGDKLLIYTHAKRLIMYRPATGKVIDMLTIQDKLPATKGTAPSSNKP